MTFFLPLDTKEDILITVSVCFFLFFCLFVFFYQQNICFCILQKIESHAGLEGHDLESCEHINKLNKLYKKSLPPYNILCNLYIYTMTCIISMHAL